MNGFIKSEVTLILALCSCGVTHAHAHLLQSAPAANTIITATPDALSLDFSEGVQLAFTKVSLRGPDRAIVSTAQVRPAPKDKRELLVSLPRTLASGQYTVEWHPLSHDGHATHGSYEFGVVD